MQEIKQVIYVRDWLLILFRGILAVLFGFAAIFFPGLTLYSLVILFGLFALISGSILFIEGLVNSKKSVYWSDWILEGIIEVALGLLALFYPFASMQAFFIIILLWFFVVRGIFQIIYGIKEWRNFNYAWVFIVSGIISILLSILLFMLPIAIIYIIAFYAIFFGILLIIYSLILKSFISK